jgi:hypothetical protein
MKPSHCLPASLHAKAAALWTRDRGPEATIARFAEAEGLTIAAEFVEAESGKGTDALDRRPQLAAALAAARTIKCSVVVSKLDRLSRDVAFVSGLMAQRVPSSLPSWDATPIPSCCTSTPPWPRRSGG